MDLIGLQRELLPQATRLTIEFLDLSRQAPPSITVKLDLIQGTTPAGRWDTVIELSPDSTVIQSAGPRQLSGLLSVAWDFDLDRVRIDLPRFPTSMPYKILLEAHAPDSEAVVDTLGPLLSDGRDLRTANLLLVFWDVLRTETPALTLRSWDGAHSGPAGERFGLSHLLDAVQETQVAVNLLDLNAPDRLAGLEFIGRLARVRSLLEARLIDLPSTMPADYDPREQPAELTGAIQSDRAQVSAAFGLPPSNWLSLNTLELSAGSLSSLHQMGVQGVVAPIDPALTPAGVARVEGIAGMLIAARPRSDTGQLPAQDGGLNLDWRRMLVEAAVGGQPGYVVLGGSLPQTFWGDAQQGRQALSWIAAHPWIRVRRLTDLTRSGQPSDRSPLTGSAPSRATIAPEDSLELSGGENRAPGLEALLRDLYARATSPIDCAAKSDARWDDAWAACSRIDPGLSVLRLRAFETAALLEYARTWSAGLACSAATETQSLLQDIDGDGLPEAVLRNDRLLAVMDPVAGRVSMLAACIPGYGVTLLSAPRSVVAIGLSPPFEWNLAPGTIPELGSPLLAGGFVSPGDAELVFTAAPAGGGFRFVHPDGLYSMHYTLSGNEFTAAYSSDQPAGTALEIGLLIAPEQTRQPGFPQAYRVSSSDTSLELTIDSGSAIRLEFSAPGYRLDSFLDSPAPELAAEDPNQEYPPGHYLPLPFFLIRTTVENGQQIVLTANPASGAP